MTKATPEPQDLQPYQSLLPSEYRLERRLAAGGFGQTFLTQGPKGPCVLKMLSLQAVENWKSVELFERETHILQHLNHPGIPRFYDSFSRQQDDKSYFFLVQEYLAGQSLQESCDSGKHFTEPEILQVALKLTEILAYLHAFSPPVIHRDIKPSNIMLGKQGKVWLIDFGAVRDTLLRQGERGSTIVGTFGYMPLEQYEGRAEPASDLFGLGMSLIFALSGKEPMQMPKKNLKADFRPFVSISPRLAHILDRLIEPALEHRYRSAQDLKQDLEKCFKTAPFRKKSAQAKRKSASRTDWQSVFSSKIRPFAALFSVLLLGSAWWMYQQGQSPQSSSVIRPSQGHQTPTNVVSEPDFPPPWQALKNSPENVYHLLQAGPHLWQSDFRQIYALQTQGPGLDDNRFWQFRDLFQAGEKIIQIAQLQWQHIKPEQNTLLVLTNDPKPEIAAYHYALNAQSQPEGQWTRLKLPSSKDITASVWQGEHFFLAQEDQLWQWDAQHQWQPWVKIPARRSGLSLPRKIEALASDPKSNTLWLGVGSQLWKLKDRQLTLIWDSPSSIVHLALGSDQHLWIGTYQGLFELRPGELQAHKQLPHQQIRALLPSGSPDQGTLWVGTDKEGLFYYDGQHWLHQSWTQGLPDDQVQALALDGQARLWISINQEKLHYAPEKALIQTLRQQPKIQAIPSQRYANACTAVKAELAASHLPTDQNQSGEIAWRKEGKQTRIFFRGQQICPDGNAVLAPDGSLYLPEWDGLVQVQNGVHKPLHWPYQDQNYRAISALYADHHQGLWLNSSGEGLFVYRSEGPKRGWHQVADKSIGTVSLGENSQHEVLVGRTLTHKPALQVYRQGQLQTAKLPSEGLFSPSLYALQGGRFGTLIGSSQGLWIGNDALNQWQILNRKQGLPFDFIDGLSQGPKRIWFVGSRGLGWWQPQHAQAGWLNTRSGLFADRLEDLALDGQERLWLVDDQKRVAIYQVSDLLARHATLQKSTMRK